MVTEVAENTPQTLQQAIEYFADSARCFEFVKAMRWPTGTVCCPRCGGLNVGFIKTRKVWECREKGKDGKFHPLRQFTLKVGTIFEDSPLPLKHWLLAMWMVANCKNGVSSYEVGRALGVTQKTAWFMLSRLRLAMQDGETGGKLGGEVEIDETYIGGKARNMHAAKRRASTGPGIIGKVAVMGLLTRHDKAKGQHSKVRLMTLPKPTQKLMEANVVANVKHGSRVYTDEHNGYTGLSEDYLHKVIVHAETYVKGNVHTNGIENFWSLLKRTLRGTYVSVESFHLFRYLDEQAFRFNERGTDDATRFTKTLRQIVGRRLDYKTLTAQETPA